MTDQIAGQVSVFGDEPAKPWNDPLKPGKPPEGGKLQPAEMGYRLKLAPELEPLRKPLKSFKPHPRNLRVHNLDAIAASLDLYGQQTPIVVQASTGFVCKGNGTWKAAKMLGAETLAVSVEEFDDETAWMYLLADNRASDLASYDKQQTVKALTELAEAGQLQSTLWSLDDLETLQAETGQIVVNEPEFAGDYAIDPETLAERRERVVTRTGDKMRQTSVILTVAEHERFMANIVILRKRYGTTGVIATVVEAVKREAARDEPAASAEAPELTEDELLQRVSSNETAPDGDAPA